MKSNLDQSLIGDAIMVLEFIHVFGVLFEVEQVLDTKVTLGKTILLL
jgi:hypothetical protein